MARSGRLGAGTVRIVAAILIAALAAELAVLALSPAQTGPDPAPVELGRFFDSERVALAEQYRGDQRRLLLIGLAVELAALTALALGRPRWSRRALTRVGERPVLGAAAAGAGVALALALLALPVGTVSHELAVDVGLSTQGLWDWLLDRARSVLIGAALAAVGAVALVSAQRRLRRTWWLVAAGLVTAYAIVLSWLAPVVLAPLFNDFEELPEGPARTQVLDLAERAGVDVGEVLSVDASRRSTALNAYVAGLGGTKRVVLYDNLLAETSQAELRSVVAHELGHVANRDVPRGILFVALVAPFGMGVVALAGGALARRGGAEPGTPRGLPAYALVLTVVAFSVNLAGNQLSRQVERSADAFALELTDDPRGLIDLQRRLSRTNLSDPDPASPIDRALRTHPAAAERIGAAVAYRREGP